MKPAAKYIFLYLLFANPCLFFAQQKKIDSLLLQLKTLAQDTNRVSCLNSLSWEYCSTGKYSEGLLIGEETLKLANALKYQDGIATAYNNIGFIYHKQGNYPKALQNHFDALKLRELNNDKVGIGTSLNNIGLVYERQNNFPKALEYHTASLKIKLEIGNKKPIAASYNNIGNVYFAQENYALALENYNASLAIKKELKDKKGMASAYNNIAAIYQNQNIYTKALENYTASLKIKEDLQDVYGIAVAHNNIGGVYLAQHKIEEAKQNQILALKYAKEIGASDVIMIAYNSLSLCDSSLNDFRSAYQNYKLYKQFSDTLFNEENSQKVAQMSELYESEKKDKQISILNIENETKLKERKQLFFIIILISMLLIAAVYFYIIKQKDNVLLSKQKKEIIEKTELLKFQAQEIARHQSQMNPHFIFNALNSLQGNILNQQTDSSLEQLNSLSKLMRLTLNNSEKEWISIAEEQDYLKRYVDFELKRFEVKFKFTITINNAIDIDNVGVPPMLIQPLVENCIKHAQLDKVENGTINLEFTKNNNSLEIKVSDNGCGRNLNKEQTNSKAIYITQNRIKELNYKNNLAVENAFTIIDLKNETGQQNGTEIQLIIPYFEIN